MDVRDYGQRARRARLARVGREWFSAAPLLVRAPGGRPGAARREPRARCRAATAKKDSSVALSLQPRPPPPFIGGGRHRCHPRLWMRCDSPRMEAGGGRGGACRHGTTRSFAHPSKLKSWFARQTSTRPGQSAEHSWRSGFNRVTGARPRCRRANGSAGAAVLLFPRAPRGPKGSRFRVLHAATRAARTGAVRGRLAQGPSSLRRHRGAVAAGRPRAAFDAVAVGRATLVWRVRRERRLQPR